jgi:ribosomal protein S8
LISNQSKIFTISYHSLKLLTKKSGSSVFLISTSKGLLSNKEAINQKNGGIILGFFSL